MAGVGARIKQMRRERGWSIREAARIAGVSPATLQRVERDGPLGPTAYTLDQIARGWGIAADIFFTPDVCKSTQTESGEIS